MATVYFFFTVKNTHHGVITGGWPFFVCFSVCLKINMIVHRKNDQYYFNTMGSKRGQINNHIVNIKKVWPLKQLEKFLSPSHFPSFPPLTWTMSTWPAMTCVDILSLYLISVSVQHCQSVKVCDNRKKSCPYLYPLSTAVWLAGWLWRCQMSFMPLAHTHIHTHKYL